MAQSYSAGGGYSGIGGMRRRENQSAPPPVLNSTSSSTQTPVLPMPNGGLSFWGAGGLYGAQDPNPQGGENPGLNQVQQAVYDQGLRMLQPQFDRQLEGHRQQMANQGLPVSGEAYEDEFGYMMDAQNRALMNLSDQAVLAGNQEAQRIFQNQFVQHELMTNASLQQAQIASNERMAQAQLSLQQAVQQGQMSMQQAQMELSRLQVQEQARQFDIATQTGQSQQGFENWLATQGLGLQQNAQQNNFLMGLLGMGLGGTQVPVLPVPGMQGFDPSASLNFGMGAANMQNNNQMANWQAQANNSGWGWDLLGGLGSAAIMASSRELKEDITEIGSVTDIVNSIRVKEWNYIGDKTRFLGPIAEEAPPQISDGKTVNLVNTIGLLTKAVQELTKRVEALEK